MRIAANAVHEDSGEAALAWEQGGPLGEVTFRLRLGEWEEFSRVHSRQTESICEGVEVRKSAEWSKNRKKAHVAGAW